MGEGEDRRAGRVVRKADLLSVAFGVRRRAATGRRLPASILGFGAMHLNDDRVSDAEAGRLLNAVLDLGVNLIDTARGYGLS